jgi:hypothetical protein
MYSWNFLWIITKCILWLYANCRHTTSLLLEGVTDADLRA